MESNWETAKVNGEPMRLYVSRPDGPGPFPGVVVAQHRDGVDEFVQEMTKRLARAGFLAAAPEIYHRDGPDCRDDGPTRATRLRDATVIKDGNAAVEFLKEQPMLKAGKIGIVGFCQGGRVAYLMACVNESLKVCVSYYPGNLFSAQGPGPAPFELSRQIAGPLLAHFGQEDGNPSPEHMGKLDDELTKLGKPHEFYSYPGAGHAFMNFSSGTYRPDAEKASWPRTLDFLKRYL